MKEIVSVEMAALPIWFTKNKRVYHISSDTSSSLCTADNHPTNQEFEGKPLSTKTGRVPCPTCVKNYNAAQSTKITTRFENVENDIATGIRNTAFVELSELETKINSELEEELNLFDNSDLDQ